MGDYTLFYEDNQWMFHDDAPILQIEREDIEVISKFNDTIYMSIIMKTDESRQWFRIYITGNYIDIVSQNNNVSLRLSPASNTGIYFIYLIEKTEDNPEAILKKLFISMRRLLGLIIENDGIFDDDMVSAIMPARKN